MDTDPTNTNEVCLQDEDMPSIVNTILVFFYAVAWLDLIVISYGVVSLDPAGITRYILPLLCYCLVLLTYPILNWRRFRSGRGKLSDLVWGYRFQSRYIILFLLANFLVVAWLSALNENFVNLYFMIFGITAGMLGKRRAVWPVIVVELIAFGIQSGLWQEWQQTGFNVFTPDAGGFILGLVIFVAYVIMIQALISSRIKSEALVLQLTATQKRLEEALPREKEVAVLRERDRMAREMHDVLGHALVLIAVKIEAAQRLQVVDPARSAAELEATKELVRQSMSDLRASLADLRGPDFDAGSKPLSQSLKEWANRTAAEGKFAISVNLEPEANAFPVPVQDALWRVGREAVLNVVKHARAHHAEINVFTKDGSAILTVRDDGEGIPHLSEGQARLEVDGHYGMRGMRERVEALGGRLTIRPGRDDQGTLVMVAIPLPPIPSSSPGKPQGSTLPGTSVTVGATSSTKGTTLLSSLTNGPRAKPKRVPSKKEQ